jgi:hypothetical protein
LLKFYLRYDGCPPFNCFLINYSRVAAKPCEVAPAIFPNPAKEKPRHFSHNLCITNSFVALAGLEFQKGRVFVNKMGIIMNNSTKLRAILRDCSVIFALFTSKKE